MEKTQKTALTVEVIVNAPVEKVWEKFNTPADVTKWCAASDDWHAPSSENDFREGGISKTRMEAKDGSFGFDFQWTYTKIRENETLEYTLEDDRKVSVHFRQTGNGVKVTQTFEAGDTNPLEMQQGGWQAILENFKKYVEQN